MPSSAELICIAPDRVKDFWPHVEPLLRPAVENVGLSDFRDIAAEVLHGDGLVWIAWGDGIEAAASTVLQRIGDDLVCVLTACGGKDMKRWLPLLDRIEDYARDEGCKAMRIYGRKGWLRALNDYREKAIVIEKDLS